jgi:hypothetical protein
MDITELDLKRRVPRGVIIHKYWSTRGTELTQVWINDIIGEVNILLAADVDCKTACMWFVSAVLRRLSEFYG